MKTRVIALFLILGVLAPPEGPAQTPVGTVTGFVLDGGTGAPVVRAQITIEGQPGITTQTDLEGIFKIDLPPGSHTLKLNAENYFESTVEVRVEAGKLVEANVVLSNRTGGTTVDVVEKLDAVAATAEAMIAERKLSPVVSDSISSEEIREGISSDAAGAIEKVTGVSVVDSGYVYVRGLGERYSATMLNNALMPTTEPERRVVPLDLFPASLIDSIKVLKTYSPDLPGEFSGGLVQMQTVEFPNAKTLKVSFSTGFNSNTTGKPFATYPGGQRDFLGFDDGTRSIPTAIPGEQRLFAGRFSPEQLQAFGRSFSTNWEPEYRDKMRPSQSYSVSAGNTFGRLGLVGAWTFANSPSRLNEEQRYFVLSGGKPLTFTDYPKFESNNESVRMGGVFNAAFRINGSNKLVLRNTITRDTDKEARVFEGFNGGIDGTIQSTRLRWVERGIYSTGVEGEHALPLGGIIGRWQVTYSRSTRKEPDLREVIRGRRDDGRFSYLSLPQSGTRFYNDLKDQIVEPQADITKPLYWGAVSGIFKAGFRSTIRTRDFEARRFRFIPVRANTVDFLQPSNQLLGASNIRPDAFEIRENTRGTDRYDAQMHVHGVYGMLDLVLGPRWRVIGGARFEDADISVETIDPLVPGSIPSIAKLANRDVLPGLNVVYALTPRQNLRFGYGRTLSRPDFRELSPFDFTNVLGGFNTVGNPNLQRAKIDNFDGRWEWFLGGDQLIAASYFLKRFTDPIEVTIQPTTDLRQSYINATDATNQGVEFEFRRSLSFLGETFRPFSMATNLTVVGSTVTIPDALSLLLTSRSRPLVGQSRYIFNISGEWAKPEWRSQARVFFNTVSRRITDVGTFGLPDIFQERNTFIDAAYQYSFGPDGRWSVRVAGENLGNNHYRWTQADNIHRSYRNGRTLSVGLSFSIF